MDQVLIMYAGITGVGKSNSIKSLMPELENYDIHRIDDVKRDLGHKILRPKSMGEVGSELNRRVEESLDEGHGVILDKTSAKRENRQKYYDLASDYGLQVLLIECYCLERTAKKRIRGRPKRKPGDLYKEPAYPGAYDKVKKEWEDITEIEENSHVSHIRLNTEPGSEGIEEVKVNGELKQLVDKVRFLFGKTLGNKKSNLP